MHTDQSTTFGALNLYSTNTGNFRPDDAAVAELLARHVALALAHAEKVEHLERAIDARNRIGQAEGILMERHNLTADEAFMLLRTYSQHHNVKLTVIAQLLIDTRGLPGDPRR